MRETRIRSQELVSELHSLLNLEIIMKWALSGNKPMYTIWMFGLKWGLHPLEIWWWIINASELFCICSIGYFCVMKSTNTNIL